MDRATGGGVAVQLTGRAAVPVRSPARETPHNGEYPLSLDGRRLTANGRAQPGTQETAHGGSGKASS